MEKTRQTKILSIIALVIAITGMTLGFAAFSSTLSISSNATVAPNSDDFKIKVYGITESKSLPEIIGNLNESWLSDTTGMAYAYEATNTTFTPAKINNSNNGISISNIQAQYIGDTDSYVEYYFFIVNEGKYDTIIPYAPFKQYFDNTYVKTCEAEDNTNKDLINEVCNGMKLFVALGNAQTGEQYLNSINNITVDFTKGYILKPDETLAMCVGIYYDSDVLPDGNMTIEFGELNIDFTTAPIN